MAASDEEDDYMNMTFDEPAPTAKSQPETSLQRRQRLKREGEIRGRIKSKEELAAEEEVAREKALSRSLLEDAAAKKSKGFAMMAKMGFKAGGALGAKTANGGGASDARTEPIAVEVKGDRGGIGMESERKRKVREAAERIEEELREGKRVRVDPLEYRDRVRQEREVARVQAQVFAAQRLSERMAEEREGEAGLQVIDRIDGKGKDDDGDDDSADGKKMEEKMEEKKEKRPTAGAASRLLKSINVLWRGLARHREEKERDRRMRYDLEQSLSRLPTYEDDEEDADDRTALGKKQIVYVTADDLDEEDPELDQFNELEDAEKLRRLVEYLRREHRYCFWCKFTYPDDEMDGCPGVTEEDHD
ncbi:G-patch domain-containing protein [Colletotrichum orchidophilum]|uniref:G-patch domain-containing protein n=1 Tax=Colletotrichum orchidophilum TaxID=1209926 RepID=A0A1G4BBX5_9PEZI|nr:G-patch domain-containing protein [Colletotrichum orchidophilum]OHE98856.1 G-patch domain-containing protein [Colletotrichum orchidophilum]